MADIPRLRVMFSSRAATRVFGDTTLTELRLALKAQVEGIRIGGHQPFEVWIHEDDPAPAGRTILDLLHEAPQVDGVEVAVRIGGSELPARLGAGDGGYGKGGAGPGQQAAAMHHGVFP